MQYKTIKATSKTLYYMCTGSSVLPKHIWDIFWSTAWHMWKRSFNLHNYHHHVQCHFHKLNTFCPRELFAPLQNLHITMTIHTLPTEEVTTPWVNLVCENRTGLEEAKFPLPHMLWSCSKYSPHAPWKYSICNVYVWQTGPNANLQISRSHS